jgi:hypothetical protein
MSASDMRPYIGYYVDDIAAPARSEMEALWTVCFLTYVHFYHFTGVEVLFRKFGYDIDPKGALFNQFVAKVSSKDNASLAAKLQEAAQREWDAVHPAG